MVFKYSIGCRFLKENSRTCVHSGNKDIRMRIGSCRRAKRCLKEFCPYNLRGKMMGQGRCFECGNIMKQEDGRWCSQDCWNKAHPENLEKIRVKSLKKRKLSLSNSKKDLKRRATKK